jgi:hypothetical protein
VQRWDLDWEGIARHYGRVNRVSWAQFKEDVACAADQWLQRSRHTWTTDLGPLAPFFATLRRFQAGWIDRPPPYELVRQAVARASRRREPLVDAQRRPVARPLRPCPGGFPV